MMTVSNRRCLTRSLCIAIYNLSLISLIHGMSHAVQRFTLHHGPVTGSPHGDRSSLTHALRLPAVGVSRQNRWSRGSGVVYFRLISSQDWKTLAEGSYLHLAAFIKFSLTLST